MSCPSRIGKPIAGPPIDAEFGSASIRVEGTVAPGERLDLEFDYAK